MSGRTFEYRIQVRWSDSDRLGHVNNTRFVEYLQEARAHFITQCFLQAAAGTTIEPATSDWSARGATVVRKLTVDFLRPIFDDSGPLVVEVWVSRVGRTSFDVGHRVSDASGALCADAVAVMVAFDLESQLPRSLDDNEKAVLRTFPGYESVVTE